MPFDKYNYEYEIINKMPLHYTVGTTLVYTQHNVCVYNCTVLGIH